MSTDDPYAERLDRTREAMAAVGADLLVCAPSPTMRYLAGWTEHPSERHLLLFVTDDDVLFLAPEMYGDQLEADSWVPSIQTWDDGDDPRALIEALAADLEIGDGRVLVDDRMWARFTFDLRGAIPDASFGLASAVTTDLRIRKDDTELDRLREAARITDAVCVELRELGEEAIGLTERDLAEEIERRLSAHGGEGNSFEPIVGSGPNGARPHHGHGDRTIERGDPVVLDFGTLVDGYPGDQTRTVVFAGDPPEGYEEVHETVLNAHHAGVDAVEPGVTAESIDRAAREVIEDAGYGDEFLHRTGHGVGLEVHEPPYIVEGNDRELEPGMVFSVEPGIYLEGEFGVRIEDLVVVTENGCERLNDTPRTW